MTYCRRIIAPILEVAIGAVLTVLGVLGKVDSYWSGMGGALIATGTLLLIKHIRYQSNADYREKQDTELKDERNRFIGAKAWSWAGYLYVIVAALGSILFRLIDQAELSTFCGFSVCLIITLYWLSHVALRRKY